MEIADGQRLREKWDGKPCDHPKLERERALGAQTGDMICTTCGQTFIRSELKKENASKDGWFKKSGILCIQHYTAESCYNHPAEVVTEFLDVLSKHKR